MTKSSVIIGLFLLIVFLFFTYSVLQLNAYKKEGFKEADEDAKSTTTEKGSVSSSESLSKNLAIINKFEEIHGRKIKTEELEKLSAQLKDTTKPSDIEKAIKGTREGFTKDKEEKEDKESPDMAAMSTASAELQSVVKKLNDVIAKLHASTSLKSSQEKREDFTFEPFSNERKFMSFA